MSSKIKFIYILIGILLLLVSIKSGFGLQEDFNAYASQKDIYACSCAITPNRVILENTGDVTSVYDIGQSGKASAYSSVADSGFSLKSGESKEMTSFIRVPCGVTGEFDLKTQFSTLFGLQKEFDQKVIAKDCVDINLMMVEASTSTCPCSPAKYVFTIENMGTFLETYRLAIDSEFAELSEDMLVLGPKQMGNVTAFITAPCGSYGDLSFIIKALAERSGMIAELPFVLHVFPCYEYSMTGLNQYSVCSGLGNLVPITIKNTANIANTYFLGTDADWANFEDLSISLWGGEQKTLNLNVNPSDIEPANYNLTLSAVTTRGEIRKTLNIATNVENCYSVNLSSESAYAQVVDGEKGVILAHIKNDGTRASNYSLILEGPGWLSMDSNMAALNPGAAKDVKISYDVPANFSGLYPAVLYASLVDFPEKTSTTELKFDVLRVEDAYSIEIDADKKELDTNYDGKTVPITFTNKGIRDGKYTLSMSTGDTWIGLDKTRLEIPQGSSQQVGLVLMPKNETPEGVYFVTIDAILDNTNIAYSRTFNVVLRQKTTWEKISGFFRDYWMYITPSLAALLLLLILLIGIRRYRKTHPKEEKKEEKIVKEEPLIKKEKDRRWMKWLSLIVLLLLLLAGIGFAGYRYVYTPYLSNVTWSNITELYQPEPQPEVEMPPVETGPITEATIFVNRTGLRGEGNIIEVIGLENITIPLIIQNSDEPNTYVIRVSEDISWVTTDKKTVNIPPGERQVINIFVTPTPEVQEGNYNLSVNINIAGREKPISEEIILGVREKKPFYEEYMWYLIGGALALILILLILKVKEGRKKKPEGFETVEAKEKEEGGLKNVLVIILLILVILCLIGGLAYLGFKFIPPMLNANNATSTPAETEAPAEVLNETAVQEIPEENYEHVFVKKGTETLIPITISNVNKTTTFRISVKKDVDWLHVDNELVDVAPGENKTINLLASPDLTIEDGDYKVSVDINIAQGEKVFSRYFILNVRKNRFTDMLSYLYYALAGIVALIALMKIIGRKKDSYDKDFGPEETTEEKPKKKRTNFRLE